MENKNINLNLKEKRKKYFAEYYQRPEVKEKIKEYNKKPERIIRRKEIEKKYKQKSDVKIRVRDYQRKYQKIKNNLCINCEKQILTRSKRCQDCARKPENNPNWLGGTSFLPYSKEFTRKFKKWIRKRDNYICLKCGRPEHEEKEEHNKALSIHHINSQKDLTIKENCCALCQRCNNEVNYKRKYYQQFFQSVLADKYGYKYEDGEIILSAEVINNGK